MKSVRFLRTVFDSPVLNLTLVNNDGFSVVIKDGRRVTFLSDEELSPVLGIVWINYLFGKIERALARGPNRGEWSYTTF